MARLRRQASLEKGRVLELPANKTGNPEEIDGQGGGLSLGGSRFEFKCVLMMIRANLTRGFSKSKMESLFGPK